MQKENHNVFKEYYSLLKLSVLVFAFIFTEALPAQTLIKGSVKDAKTQEAIPGVTISIKGTTTGVISDDQGYYQINVASGEYTIVTSYISYQPMEITEVKVKKEKTITLDILLTEAAQNLNDVIVVARKNMESEMNLLLERQRATVAVENLGAKEMSAKGLSTVADGIKKVTGISMEGNTKVFVRGLGDRYSMTSLNGFPIASPNPDNKLIPLTLFPTSVVKNVTVSKVYQPSVFGDYSGAHIDVETKENIGNNYITIGVSTGGKTNALFKDFYSSDKGGVGVPYLGITKGFNQSDNLKNMTPGEFSQSILNKNLFNTTFNIEKNSALPELGLEFGIGHSWNVGGQKLNAMLGINFDNSYTIYDDAYTSTVNAQGVVRDMFNYNKYSYETTATAIGQVSYTLRRNDILSYNVMYVNNSEDDYTIRDGFDAEGVEMKGSNSVYHLYTLFNNQLTGKHQFDRLFTDWQVSYGRTTSDEPDRRQVMYTKNDNGKFSLFKLNQQGTMRYFGELFEDEWNGDFKIKYLLNENEKNTDFIRLGGAMRSKSRDFNSTNYYYGVKNVDIEVDDIFNPDSYLSYSDVANGKISVNKVSMPRDSYYAGSDIYASFVDMEFYPLTNLLIAAGVRYEHSSQWVRYSDDSGEEKRAELKTDDLFPALNVRYSLSDKQNLRFSFSRTVTRPSFIEMAPFEYKESYGGAFVRGNENIKNGYNYNADIRYEIFPASGDMFSLSAYYKYLKSPIERTQRYSGSAYQSFDNVNKGLVAGAELEIRKYLLKDLRVDFNASYIYTHISLLEGGIYTDKKRELQGASPYLFNLDINYSPKFKNEKEASFSLVYNLRGPRISSVGINGVNNVVEKSFNSLDFVVGYSFNSNMKLKLQAKNLINQKQEFTQKIAETGKDEVVEYYKKGLALGVGFSLNF